MNIIHINTVHTENKEESKENKMKTETYRKTEKLLKEFVIYNKILEIREEEKTKKAVENINKAMECLTETEKKIITDFFMKNKTMSDISKEIDLTREYTSKVKTSAIRKIEYILFGKDAA